MEARSTLMNMLLISIMGQNAVIHADNTQTTVAPATAINAAPTSTPVAPASTPVAPVSAPATPAVAVVPASAPVAPTPAVVNAAPASAPVSAPVASATVVAPASTPQAASTPTCACTDCACNSFASLIPSFQPSDVQPVPSYQGIINATTANEAQFNTQLSTANQALIAYLRQCIVNGACDAQQVSALMDTIQQAYVTFVQQAALLAYAKAQRLQDETAYQAYLAQIAGLQTGSQQAANQAGSTWFSVEAGYETADNALAVSQNSATAINANQAQIVQVNAQIAALLATLATPTSAPSTPDYTATSTPA